MTFYNFCIDVTFEMRTSEYFEICISIDTKLISKRVFMWNRKKGKESKVMETQKESKRVCVCVGVLIKTNDSVDQHPQQHR